MQETNILNKSVKDSRKNLEDKKRANIRNSIGKKRKIGDIATKNNIKTSINLENSRKENRNNADNPNVCSSCGSSDILIDTAHSEVVCKSCGMVLEENIIDSSPSGTSINREGRNMNQHGSPGSLAIHDRGLNSCYFDPKAAKKNSARWKRLRRWDNQSKIRSSQDKNLSRAFNELNILVSRLSLPKTVRNESAFIYRKAVKKDLVRGRSISLIIAASLYAGCRRCKVPRSLDQIAKVSDNNKKALGRSYRFLNRNLDLKLGLPSPADYIPQFCSDLGLSSQIEVKAFEIISEAQNLGISSSKQPIGVAAGALYWACTLLGERRTQRDIADATGVTEVTIRNRFKEMEKRINFY